MKMSLFDLYGDINSLPEDNEVYPHFTGKEWNEKIDVREVDPNDLLAHHGEDSIKEAFRHAAKWQRELVDSYKEDPPEEPIVVRGDRVIDGHHRTMAAIQGKRKIKALVFPETRRNPPSHHWPVMSYASASRYEPMAKAKNVSAVARSGRGFMRAYEKAGSWANLDQWWKDRRDNFVSRHMAQVRQRGEKLWKNGHPSRRALALLMWAYMPPGKTTKSNPLYRTGRHLLFSNELPEGRSNKVRYFLRGHEKPWRDGRSGFGPEWNEVFERSNKQARAMLAMRNPRMKTKVVRIKAGGRTLELRMYKRSR